VSVICRSFGGGGHLRAAGCTLDMPLDEAEIAIVAAVEAQLKKEGLI
jgi:phosphoesterase RecJ-like protein